MKHQKKRKTLPSKEEESNKVPDAIDIDNAEQHRNNVYVDGETVETIP